MNSKQMAFKRHPKSDERVRSAAILIKHLLALYSEEVLPTHRHQLLSTLLWKITEAESSKLKIRFRTTNALACGDKSFLQHEHVFQRKQMIKLLMKAAPEDVDGILADAVGCVVTKDGHAQLKPFDDLYGWDRYRKAGIVIIDTETGKEMTWPEPFTRVS